MKRYTATVRVDVEAESIESRDDVLWRLCERINKNRPRVHYDDVGVGQVLKVSVSRVRPLRKRKQ